MCLALTQTGRLQITSQLGLQCGVGLAKGVCNTVCHEAKGNQADPGALP